MAYYVTKDNHLVKHAIIGISGVDRKDATCEFRFENDAISIQKEQQKDLYTVHEFTDGCAAQYKGYNISRRTDLTNDPKFFETSHGNNVCDGIGCFEQKNCDSHSRTVRPILPGQVDSCIRESSGPEHAVYFQTLVQHFQDQRLKLYLIPGYYLLMQIQENHSSYYRARNLSCFCPGCQRGTDECQHAAYVLQWQGTSVKLSNAAQKNFPSAPNECIISHHSRNKDMQYPWQLSILPNCNNCDISSCKFITNGSLSSICLWNIFP